MAVNISASFEIGGKLLRILRVKQEFVLNGNVREPYINAVFRWLWGWLANRANLRHSSLRGDGITVSCFYLNWIIMGFSPLNFESILTDTAESAQASIVVYDFDGTITTDDTFRLFLSYYRGHLNYAAKIFALLPTFALYGLRLIDRDKVKAHVIRRFFKGEQVSFIESRAESFAKDVIPGLIRPAAAEALEHAKMREKQGRESLYICSASIGPYLRAYFLQRGITNILATELKSESGVCNGDIDGYNIWGAGKVRRILAEFEPNGVTIKEAYGDSRGDRELLNAAKASFYRPFRL